VKEENLAIISIKSSLHGSNMCTVDLTTNYVRMSNIF